MKRAVISGYYGFGNTGDEAMLGSIILALRQAVGEIDFTVLSENPSDTREAHGVEAIRRTDIPAIRRAIRRSDLFISGGGSLLQDATGPRSIPYYLGLALMAKAMGKPSVFYGQGIGPVNRRLSKALLRLLGRLDLVCLRDMKSRELLSDLGVSLDNVHVTADPVLFLGPGSREEGKSLLSRHGVNVDMPLIGVFPRPWKGCVDHCVLIAKAAQHMARHIDGQIVLIPLHPLQDSQVVERMASLIDTNRVRVVEEKFHHCHSLIAGLDLVISVRLHGAVLAAISGVPTIGVSYDPKVDAFMDTVDLPSACNLENLTLEDLAVALEETWLHREEITHALRHRAEELRHKAFRNAELTANLLRGKGEPHVLGFPFTDLDFEGALKKAEALTRDGDPHFIVTANPEMLFRAKQDPELRDALLKADMVVADGVGILWASSALGRALPGKVPGIDLAHGLLEVCARKGWPVYLLGTKEEVVAQAARRIRETYTGLKIAGYHHGFFPPQHDSHVAEEIKESGAKVLLVGMGVPRQEKFLLRHLTETGASLGIGVGGSLDVMAGCVKRAPTWVRSLNIEWLYRLIREPKRWRRQVSIPWFIMETLKYRRIMKREAEE